MAERPSFPERGPPCSNSQRLNWNRDGKILPPPVEASVHVLGDKTKTITDGGEEESPWAGDKGGTNNDLLNHVRLYTRCLFKKKTHIGAL